MNVPLCICYTKKPWGVQLQIGTASLHSLRTYTTKTAKRNVSKLVKEKESDFSRRGTIF